MSRAPAEARLGRLLAIVPWVAAHDGPRIEEVCLRFGVGEKELIADLNLLFMCGLHPFTPDVLIDVDISDGRVWISMADYFRRPLRLTPQEALALLSAGRAYLKVPVADSTGALATALDKLHTVLGFGPDSGPEVELGAGDPAVLATLRAAVTAARKIRIGYYSFGRDAHGQRTVRPWRLFNSGGHWYLHAWAEDADAERTFRVDRITGVETTDETFERPALPGAAPPVFNPSRGDPLWVLDLAPGAHWVVEQYPNEGVEDRSSGVLRVRLRSGSPAWMERLLLRGGPAITVVEGDTWLGPAAASRLLARYRRSPAP